MESLFLTFTVPPSWDGGRLDRFLRGRGVSTSLLRSAKYLPQGICVDGKRTNTNALVNTGQAVRLLLPPEEKPATAPEPFNLPILYETADTMVLAKPAGLVVHPTRSHKTGTLAAAFGGLMAQRGEVRAFRPVGRLDGDTSGAMLLAMHAYAAPLLAQSLQKEYLALVQGCVGEAGQMGTIEAPLGPAGDSVVRQAVRRDGRPSITDWQVLAANSKASLVRVMPRTGRTHQIRAHFAHAGFPLVGDGLYGGPAWMGRHALHCASVTFCEPNPEAEGGRGVKHSLNCPLPQDMQNAICQLLPGAEI